MAERRVSGVPVIATDGKAVGIISEKDFLKAMGGCAVETFMGVVAQCLSGGGCLAAPIRTQYAKDIMTTPAITISELTPALELTRIFSAHKINRVPVTDAHGQMVGIVSREGMVKTPLFLAKTCCAGSEGEAPFIV